MIIKDFNIKQILESGQCFRYMELDDNRFRIVYKDIDFYVTQIDDKNIIYEDCSLDFFNYYFDLGTDYTLIKSTLGVDEKMKKIISCNSGIRILNQDKWECLISFILSQQNNIPRIRNLIDKFCVSYGTLKSYAHIFPQPKDLQNIKIDDLNDLGFGYRSRYVIDAINKSNILSEISDSMSTSQIVDKLKSIIGIGDKVASCIALFAFHRFDIFPVDVWIRRAMIDMYNFKTFVTNEYIQDFALYTYGEYSGIAQQYIYKFYRDGEK